jgi:UDPglucose 6-dehydrogenase
MKICVIGTGYVGLVTGACLADFGNNVICVDNNKDKIAGLKKGLIDFHELGLQELVRKNINSGRLKFEDSLRKYIIEADVIFIAVGTPPLPSGEADLSALKNVAEKLGAKLKNSKKNKFNLLVVKSTVPVGTSKVVEKIILKSGLKLGTFEVVSNPEFLREGKAVADFLHPDRIVIGALGKKACNLMAELYRPLNARLVFMDPRSAELVKYTSNVFLANRISLINEIANICEFVGANIKCVVEGIGYDARIGNLYLKPGIGYGGSCLPKDVSALIHLAERYDYNPVILKAVHQRNILQREHFAKKIVGLLKEIGGKVVAVWGLSFKPQTDDLRDAPAITIIKTLVKEGIKVKAYDPLSNLKARLILPEIEFCNDPYKTAKGSDAVVIMTEWNEFREIDLEKIKKIVRRPLLIDGRNIFNPIVLREFGIMYTGVGIRG